MTLPAYTHLQVFIAHILAQHGNKAIKGSEIRTGLTQLENLPRYEGPKFYQLMARMERAGFVKGKPTQFIDEPPNKRKQIKKEREYRLTPKGKKELSHSVRFYQEGVERAKESGFIKS